MRMMRQRHEANSRGTSIDRLSTRQTLRLDPIRQSDSPIRLPISVVDLDQCQFQSSLRVAIAPENSEYVFNASGQTIKLDGLLCLFDDEGPCANAVQDSQRTKTNDATKQSLVVIWGSAQLVDHSSKTESWFQELIENQKMGDVVSCDLLQDSLSLA